ncbi:MAG: oxidoreductase [bacterium]
MSFSAQDLPDLHGHRAVVTGANSGIGLVTALELARAGAEVVLACRNLDKGAAAADSIRADASSAKIEVAQLDLSSLASVRHFAETWTGPLDLLVNNAGVMAPLRRAETGDGFERQMGTNHLGHYALSGRLLPFLLAAPTPRVVTVSSVAHRSARLDLEDLQSQRSYRPQQSYGNSKLANLLFALELQRRADVAGRTLVSTAAHPGVTATGLVTNPDGLGGNRLLRRLAPIGARLVGQPVAQAALPTLYAATVAAPGSYTGPQGWHESRGEPGPASKSVAARDPELAAGLWERSEALTGVEYDWSVPAGS